MRGKLDENMPAEAAAMFQAAGWLSTVIELDGKPAFFGQVR